MPVDKKRATVKTVLLAPAGTMLPWGLQQILVGDTQLGLIGMSMGFVLLSGYVALQEYDLNYEEEVMQAVASEADEQTRKRVVAELQTSAEDIAEYMNTMYSSADDGEQ